MRLSFWFSLLFLSSYLRRWLSWCLIRSACLQHRIRRINPRLPWWLKWWRMHLQCGRPGFNLWVGKIPWRRAWKPTLLFLPGESPWPEEHGGLQSMELPTVQHDWATKHSTGSIPGSGRFPREGNGNPSQCSCLGNLKNRGAWWATVHRVAKEPDMT